MADPTTSTSLGALVEHFALLPRLTPSWSCARGGCASQRMRPCGASTPSTPRGRLSPRDAWVDRIFPGSAVPGLMSSNLVPENAIVRADRVFVALRKSGRVLPGARPVFHAVTPYCRMSLCADEPGAGSYWAELPGEDVTCRACLRRLRRLAGSRHSDGRLGGAA